MAKQRATVIEKPGEIPSGMDLEADADTAVAVAEAPVAEPAGLAELRAELAALGDPEAETTKAVMAYVTHKLAHENAVRAGELRLLELQTAKRRTEYASNQKLETIRLLRKRIAAMGG